MLDLARLDVCTVGVVGRKSCPDCGGFGTTVEQKDHYDDGESLFLLPRSLPFFLFLSLSFTRAFSRSFSLLHLRLDHP